TQRPSPRPNPQLATGLQAHWPPSLATNVILTGPQEPLAPVSMIQIVPLAAVALLKAPLIVTLSFVDASPPLQFAGDAVTAKVPFAVTGTLFGSCARDVEYGSTPTGKVP